MSSAPLSSSPRPSDSAIFSDDPHHASSPPSSPPGFPWERQSHPQEPAKRVAHTVGAFSILGKRKALSETSDNAHSNKKPKVIKTKANNGNFTQLQLSLGQSTRTTCKTCGMEYVTSSAKDRVMHDKFHAQTTLGVDVGKSWLKDAREDALWISDDGEEVIVAITRASSKASKTRARDVLEVVQRELGAVEIKEEELWSEQRLHSTEGLDGLQMVMLGEKRLARYEAYIYIRSTKAVGLLLAERIHRGHIVIEPPEPTKPATPEPTTALERLRAKRSSLAIARPIEISKHAVPACLGISRIWSSAQARKQGVATALLKSAAEQFGISEAGRTQVAFSQPTESGAALARKWFGKRHGWCVYVD